MDAILIVWRGVCGCVGAKVREMIVGFCGRVCAWRSVVAAFEVVVKVDRLSKRALVSVLRLKSMGVKDIQSFKRSGGRRGCFIAERVEGREKKMI